MSKEYLQNIIDSANMLMGLVDKIPDSASVFLVLSEPNIWLRDEDDYLSTLDSITQEGWKIEYNDYDGDSVKSRLTLGDKTLTVGCNIRDKISDIIRENYERKLERYCQPVQS